MKAVFAWVAASSVKLSKTSKIGRLFNTPRFGRACARGVWILLKKMIKGCAVLLLCGAMSVQVAWASGDGHGGGGGAAPLKFTTNLGNSRYLQFEVVLEAATPEAAHELEIYRPRIQHQVILMLSDQRHEVLATLKGKLELQAQIQDIANHIIHEKPKTGVKDVLFTSFIIQ